MMKRSLLILLLSCLGFAGAEDFTVSNKTTLSGYSSQGTGNYYGFTLKLTDSFMTPTGGDLGSSFTAGSISLISRTSGSMTLSSFKIAVYSYEGDSATTNTDFTLVGLSNAGGTSSLNTEMCFTFDTGLTLESNKQYRFLFVNDTATTESLTTLSESATYFSLYQSNAVAAGISVASGSSLPSGDGTYKSSNLNSWESSYMPYVTFTEFQSIPEPATASLLLLSLAGLAIRKR